MRPTRLIVASLILASCSGLAVAQTVTEQLLAESDAAKVDVKHLEQTLMDEGLRKFADPQKALLALIAAKRGALAGAT